MNRLLRNDHQMLLPCVLAGGWCLLSACGSSGSADPVDSGVVIEECKVSPAITCPSPALRYSDVKPIFDQRCSSCHSGTTEQWPLTDYGHVASWFDIIPPEVVNCRMPPPDAGVPITNAERTKILTWLHCGFPP